MRQEFQDRYNVAWSGWLSRANNAALLRRDVMPFIPNKWRVDAKVFLVTNIYYMIVEPLIEARSVNLDATDLPSDEEAGGLSEALRADLKRIVNRSVAIAADRKRQFVSATSVAIALGQLAPYLETTAFQIWGPRPRPQNG